MGQLERIKPASLPRLLKTPSLYTDGGGLALRVKESGAAAWVYRYMESGRSFEMGLGSLSAVSIAKAREKARSIRAQRAEGVDPLKERKIAEAKRRVEAERAMTFKECAEAYIASHRDGWRNPKHIAQWSSTLETYAYPIMGNLPVEAIDLTLVMRVLEQNVGSRTKPQRLWIAKNETASRVRGRIESVLGWAASRELRKPDNPARWKGVLEHQLPKRAKVATVKHHAALPYEELPAFYNRLQRQAGLGARALELAILTGGRTGEVINAPWSEFDLKQKTWTIPADRMKGGREHVVPLCLAARKLLRSLPSYVDRGKRGALVFPGAKAGKPLSNMAMLMLLKKRMAYGDKATVHGFRSTFRDWVAETTSHSPEAVEMALAHAIKSKTEGAYRRGNLFKKRVRVMIDWSRYCLSESRVSR